MARKTSLAAAFASRAPEPQTPPDPAAVSETASRARRVLPIDTAAIHIPPRLRGIDPDAVSHIAESIAAIGLQSPIAVTKHPKDPGLLVLVAGAHRLEAVRGLGWPRIEALVVDGSPDELRLIEIDENLIRADLTPLDRARFLRERKKACAALAGPDRRGGDRRSPDYAREPADPPGPSPSWAENTAERIGLSERAIHRAVRIGEGIPEPLADALAQTPIARREGDLFRLAQMPAEDKDRALHQLQNPGIPRTTLAALMGPSGRPPEPATLDLLKKKWSGALKKTWATATPGIRENFIVWLQTEGCRTVGPDDTQDNSNETC